MLNTANAKLKKATGAVLGGGGVVGVGGLVMFLLANYQPEKQALAEHARLDAAIIRNTDRQEALRLEVKDDLEDKLKKHEERLDEKMKIRFDAFERIIKQSR